MRKAPLGLVLGLSLFPTPSFWLLPIALSLPGADSTLDTSPDLDTFDPSSMGLPIF